VTRATSCRAVPNGPGRTSLAAPWKCYVCVFLVALAARAGFGLVRLVRAEDRAALGFPDELQYWAMAESLRAGHGLVDELGFRATRMPVYPGLLSLLAGTRDGVVWAKAAQWLIGATVAALAAGMASVLLGRRVAWIAGLLVAMDPFLVAVSSLLLTETLFLVVLVALWCIAARMMRTDAPSPNTPWVMLGAVGALCVYVRESTVGLVLFLLGFLLIDRRFDRRSVIGAALAGLVMVAALVPWAARNQRVTGHWIWLTTRSGISLYDGVHPQASGASDLGDLKQMPAVAGLNEAEWNRYFLRESLAAIKAEPGRVVRLGLTKLGRMWNPVPNAETYRSKLVRLVSAAWTLPTFAFALAGMIVLPKLYGGRGMRIALFLLLPALYFSALHSLFVGSVRYRLGAVPMIGTLAAAAIANLVDRKRGAALDDPDGRSG